MCYVLMMEMMETGKVYRSPEIVIVEISTEQAIFALSFYGEDIEEWEDM